MSGAPAVETAAQPAADPGSEPGSAAAQREALSRFAVARLAYRSGDPKTALEEMAASVELDPEAPYLRLEYARMLTELGQLTPATGERNRRFQLAREQLAVADRRAGDTPELAKEVGLLYLDLSEGSTEIIESARRSLEQARKAWPDDPELLVPLGQIYRAQGDLAAAVDTLRTAVENVPGNDWVESLLTRSLLDLGQERLRQGEPDEAEKVLEEILVLRPGNADARGMIADILSQRADHAGAVEALRGIEPEQLRPELARRLVWELFQVGELDDAARLAEGLELDEEGAARTLQILLLAARGRTDEAAAALAAQVAETAGNAVTAGALAQALVDTGQAPLARTLLTDLVASLESRDGNGQEKVAAGASALIRLELAQLQADAGAWSEVLATLAPLENLPQADRDVVGQGWRLLYAEALEEEGRGEEALRFLPERVGRGDTAELEARRPLVARRALTLFRLEREDEARKVLENLASPGDVPSLLAAARVYQNLERYADAVPLFRRAVELDEDSLEGLYFLGSAYERTGAREGAIRTFRTLLEREPDFAPALNYLGYMYAERGENLDEARNLIERAVTMDPDNGAYVDSLGWTYYQLGEHEEAARLLEKAVKLVPEDATVYEHLGDVYVALGRHRKAQQVYQRSLDLGDDNADSVRRKLEQLVRNDLTPPPPGS